MLTRLFGRISQDIGIDLGTANTLVYVMGRGIAINEPSVVAINQKTGEILAIGKEAQQMVGRTPSHIVASRPLIKGVISDYEVTERMLHYFIDRVHEKGFFLFPRPRVVVGIPSGVTEVEKKAVWDATKSAGAREVYLIEEPMAAAIGARLPIQDPAGSVIVDIGGGTTEVAVISLGGIVASRSLRIAGDKLTDDIIQYTRDEFKLFLGERTAEDIKIKLGNVSPEGQGKKEAIMRGRDVVTGLPREMKVTDRDIWRAIERSVNIIVSSIRDAVEETPPELVADIMERGIVLAGGGALLPGFDKLIERETGVPVIITEDPLTAVVRGTGIVLEKLNALREVLVDPDIYHGTPK